MKSWKSSLLNEADNCGSLDPSAHKLKCVDKEDHFFFGRRSSHMLGGKRETKKKLNTDNRQK